MKIDANFWSGFKEDLAIQDVNTAMLSQPTLFAKWSQEYSEAYAKREDLKWVLDKTYAVINERVSDSVAKGMSLADAQKAVKDSTELAMTYDRVERGCLMPLLKRRFLV